MKLPSYYFRHSRSDKWLPVVNYNHFYNMVILLLNSAKGRPINVLEVGCSHHVEGSPKAFRLMPYVGLYVGIDRDPIQSELDHKCVFLQGEAYSDEMVDRASEHGPYDLIIDDGSHLTEDWNFFLEKYSRLGEIPYFVVVEDMRCRDLPDTDELIISKHIAERSCEFGWRFYCSELEAGRRYADNV